MKKLLYILFLIPIASFGQSKLNTNQLPDTVRSAKISINSPTNTPVGGKAYFYGTSITYGYSNTSKRWTTIVSNGLRMTEFNYGHPGDVASNINLANIPTKSSLDRFLVIEYGANEAITGVSTSTFQTNMQTIITNAISKGWSGNNIILITIFASEYTSSSTTPTILASFNTTIRTLATTNGCAIIDMYTDFISIPAIALTNDQLHPNSYSSRIFAQQFLNTMPTILNIGTQKAIINGTTEITGLIAHNLPAMNGDSSQLVGINGNGKFGMVSSLPKNFLLNRTLINGPLIRAGAYSIKPTYADSLKDDIMQTGGKTITPFNSTLYTSLLWGDGGNSTTYFNNYSAGAFTFNVVDGTKIALQVNNDGAAGVLIGYKLNMTALQPISSIQSAQYTNQIIVNNSSVNMDFTTNIAAGVSFGNFRFLASNGASIGNPLTEILRLNCLGRATLQTGGTYTDIPSSILSVNSTTEGILAPRMTTTQFGAISSKAEGLQAYDLTLHVPTYYDGTNVMIFANTTGTQTLINKIITSSTNVLGGVTMTLGSDANYDTYYRNSSGILTRLPNGTNGQVYGATTGGAPSWITANASNVGIYNGNFIATGTATTTFTVTIGTTIAGALYAVNVTPTDALAAGLFYVTNKTTTTFDVVYLSGLTGSVTFDWSVFKQ